MFVTRKQAAERLAQNDNLCREQALPESTPSADVYEGEETELPEDEEEVSKRSDVIALPTMAKLDALIRVGSKVGLAKQNLLRSTKGGIEPQNFRDVADILGDKMASEVLGTAPLSFAARNNAILNTNVQTGEKNLIERKLKKMRTHVAVRATRRLNHVMTQLSPLKIDAIESPIELARLGRDLAQISQAMGPKEEVESGGVHFHVYRPELKQVNNYETVTVGSGSGSGE